MGTRSSIAIKTEDGIKAIYCHWDGYVDNNGKILLNDYTDTEKVKALINLGDLSSLRSEIGEKQDFDDRDSQSENWCLAYHRDRGEDWSGTKPQEVADAVSFVDTFEGSSCEYFYLFDGRDWLVSNGTKDESGYPIFDFVEVAILKEVVNA